MTDSSRDGLYRVRVRREGVEVEVEAPDSRYVDEKIAELLGRLVIEIPGGGSATAPPNARPVTSTASPGKPPSLVEHVRQVAPHGGLEHVLAVGFYLEHHEGMTSGFRRRDLGRAFKAIRYTHSNPGVPIAAARKQGLLIDGSETDKIRLSEGADQWVRTRLRGE